MARYADLLVTMVLAVVGATIALVDANLGPVRALLAGPLAFALPGYALTVALFPNRLRWTEYLLLVIGLGIAVIVLSALALNVTQWGLTRQSLAAVLFIITSCASAVGAYRRGHVETRVERRVGRRPTLAPLDRWQIAACLGAVVVTGGALWVARTPVPQQPTQGYTLLWSVPAADAAEPTVRVGVRSYEPTRTAYTLRIASAGQTLQDYAIDLQPIDQWQVDVVLPPDGGHDLEALLYRADAPDVLYRRTLVRGGS